MTDTVIVEGSKSLHIITMASIAPEDREVAWSGARDLMDIRDDIGWVMGRYVQSDVANRNGHIFDLADLQQHYSEVKHTPLNMLHRSKHVVGAYVAAEMLYPTHGDEIETPYVEALASFWRSIFTEEWEETRKAHDNGSLAFSMECIPATLTCDVCDAVATYTGVRGDGYCDHLNRPGSPVHLNKPHFVGGAIVLPPARPGWAKANVKEIASYAETQPDQAQAFVDAFKHLAPHLDERNWESMMHMAIASEIPDGFEAKVIAGFNTQSACFVVPVDGEVVGGPDDTHITLAYVSDVGDMTLGDGEHLLSVIAELFDPFAVEVDGAGRFINDGEIATWLKPNAPELSVLHDAFKAGLSMMGVEINPRKYIPHITVSYDMGENDPLPSVHATINVDTIELWWGDIKSTVRLGDED